MSKVLPGANDEEKLTALCALNYKEQAVWYLNAFWKDGIDKEAELFWKYVERCGELDLEQHGAGSGLDEMKAHVFLERFDETLTVRALRERLRETGAIGPIARFKVVPLVHYLLFKYQNDWHRLVNASQGDNQDEIDRAQQLLVEVQAAYKNAEVRDREATVALR